MTGYRTTTVTWSRIRPLAWCASEADMVLYMLATGYRRCFRPAHQHSDLLPELALHRHLTVDREVAQMPVPELLGRGVQVHSSLLAHHTG